MGTELKHCAGGIATRSAGLNPRHKTQINKMIPLMGQFRGDLRQRFGDYKGRELFGRGTKASEGRC